MELEKDQLLESSQADYLFTTRTGLVEFVIIEEAMARLNDYCFITSRAVRHELSQCHKRRQDLQEGPEYYESEVGPIHRSELLMGYDDLEIPSWEEANTFISPATQILLLHVLVERSLKSLCAEYDPRNRSRVNGGHTVQVRCRPNQSKLAAYLDFLRAPCGLVLTTPPSVSHLDEQVRRVRNAFAHGDWDEAEIRLRTSSVRKAFEAASELFIAIESSRDGRS